MCVADPSCLNGATSVTTLSRVTRSCNIPLLYSGTRNTCLRFLHRGYRPVRLKTSVYYSSTRGALPILAKNKCLRFSGGRVGSFSSSTGATVTIFNSADPSCLVLRSLSLTGQCLRGNCHRELFSSMGGIHSMGGFLRRGNCHLYKSRPLGVAIGASSSKGDKFRLTRGLEGGGTRYRFYSESFIIVVMAPRGSSKSLRTIGETFISRSGAGNGGSITPGATLPIFTLPRGELSIQRTIFYDDRSVPIRGDIKEITTSPTITYPPTVPIIVDNRVVGRDAIRVVGCCNARCIHIMAR